MTLNDEEGSVEEGGAILENSLTCGLLASKLRADELGNGITVLETDILFVRLLEAAVTTTGREKMDENKLTVEELATEGTAVLQR